MDKAIQKRRRRDTFAGLAVGLVIGTIAGALAAVVCMAYYLQAGIL